MTAPAIRALIVDDEPLARARLRQLLARHADMQVVAECAEGVEAARAIERAHPDVVFLDVEMTETSGMDVAAGLAGAEGMEGDPVSGPGGGVSAGELGRGADAGAGGGGSSGGGCVGGVRARPVP